MNTNFKPFFVHHILPHWAITSKHFPRGFTAYISPCSDRTISVQVAMCSGKDEFVKKTGRETALLKAPEIINPRTLPYYLSEIRYKLFNPHTKGISSRLSDSAYAYVLKYLL